MYLVVEVYPGMYMYLVVEVYLGMYMYLVIEVYLGMYMYLVVVKVKPFIVFCRFCVGSHFPSFGTKLFKDVWNSSGRSKQG